jgi:hypothetical protein
VGVRASVWWQQQLRRQGAAAVASVLAAVLTEIYLCDVCCCREILRRNGRGQDGRRSLELAAPGHPCLPPFHRRARGHQDLPHLPAGPRCLRRAAVQRSGHQVRDVLCHGVGRAAWGELQCAAPPRMACGRVEGGGAAVPSPRHKHSDLNPDLAEIYLRLEIDTDPNTCDAEQVHPRRLPARSEWQRWC